MENCADTNQKKTASDKADFRTENIIRRVLCNDERDKFTRYHNPYSVCS